MVQCRDLQWGTVNEDRLGHLGLGGHTPPMAPWAVVDLLMSDLPTQIQPVSYKSVLV